MITYYASNMDVAEFVEDLLKNSEINWQSITITPLEKSEDYCVSIATSMSLADIKKNISDYYKQQQRI